MKVSLDQEDLDAIATRVVDLLGPCLVSRGKVNRDNEDTIFDVRGLADYLKVEVSWVYRRVADKEIPYFKVGRYPRFRKSSIDSWLKARESKAVPVDGIMKTGKAV